MCDARRICIAICAACSSLPWRWNCVISSTNALALAAGAAAGAAEHGFGQIVQAELVHLAGEADLSVGIEPEAEEPLGGMPGSVCVAGGDRRGDRQLFAAFQAHVVHGLNRVEQLDRIGRRAPVA